MRKRGTADEFDSDKLRERRGCAVSEINPARHAELPYVSQEVDDGPAGNRNEGNSD
jgi:hypothetical protein